MEKERSYRRKLGVIDADVRSSAPGEFVRLSDGLVNYELAGSQEAQTIVLISGLTVPFFCWDHTFEALLKEGFQVLRYDLFGRGYSDRPETTYNQDLFDRQLFDLLAALGVDKPVDLVGWSLGGAISVVFADRHPESVRRLCLIDPAGLPYRIDIKARIVKMPALGELIMNALGENILVSNLQDYFYKHVENESLIQRFQIQMQYTGYKRALLSTLRSGVIMGAEDAYKKVGKQGNPVLLIWGQEDRAVPFELNERVRELIPHAEFYPVDQAAHLPHYERPEIVNPLLIEFLSA